MRFGIMYWLKLNGKTPTIKPFLSGIMPQRFTQNKTFGTAVHPIAMNLRKEPVKSRNILPMRL